MDLTVMKLLCLPVWLYCIWISAADPDVKQALLRDAARSRDRDPDGAYSRQEQLALLREVASQRTFRTAAYYRAPTPATRRVGQILSVFLPGAPAMEIYDTVLGGGLKIRHGNGTVIRAEYLGRDCDVYQQVTVGAGKGGFPVIGDRVDLCSGALVFGGITVGDDVIIGAGAVVSKDVPDRAIMVGNPARQVGNTEGLRASDIAWATMATPATMEERIRARQKSA
jgi:serine acetyltransferase